MRNISYRLMLPYVLLIYILLFSIDPVMAEDGAMSTDVVNARQQGYTAGLAAGEYIEIPDYLHFSILFALYNDVMLSCAFSHDADEWNLAAYMYPAKDKVVVITKENDGAIVKLKLGDILQVLLNPDLENDSGQCLWRIGASEYYKVLYYYRHVLKPYGDDISWSSSAGATGGGAAIQEWIFFAAARDKNQLKMELHPPGVDFDAAPLDTFTINVEVE